MNRGGTTFPCVAFQCYSFRMFPRVCFLLLLVSVRAIAQDSPAQAAPPSAPTEPKQSVALPPMPATPEEIMTAAAPLYDFLSPSFKPWHMKVSYQLYDADGKPSEQGTFEYWRSSDKTYRRSWVRGGFNYSDWYVDGKAFESKSGGTLEPSERDLNLDLMPILPDLTRVGGVKWNVTFKDQKVGNMQLPCVETSVANSPFPAGMTYRGRDAVYCFDRSHPLIVALFDATGTSITYARLTRTQGRVIPRELSVFSHGRKELTATVDTLESLTGTEAEFTPPPGSKPVERKITVSGSVAQGLLLSATPPVYPEAARSMRTSGTVVLQGTIGVDGMIRDLSVVSGPKVLQQAALDAVAQWRYKPYTLNGEPVAVATTINVVFNLGGHQQ